MSASSLWEVNWLFLRYNARICAGLGPWMLVVPVASTMLVLFALMALTSLVREHTVVMVLELLGALVMAFVGSSLLRPEYQYNTLETVLTRPVSFRAIVGVRMALAGVGVLVIQALLALYLSRVMDKEFHVGTALLAAAVSMVFLTGLAVAVAALSRSPTLGFLAAGAFWALDVVFSGQLNPLVSLCGYALSIKELEGIFSAWRIGKIALVVLTLLLVWVAARAGARPAGQWHLRRLGHAAAWVLLTVAVYLGSGAVYKVRWGIANEALLGNRSRSWLQQAFRCYGTLPVAPLMGLSFARFIGYHPPWTKLQKDLDGILSNERYYQQGQLKVVAFGSPRGQWVDNALYELGRSLASDYAEDPFSPNHRLGVKCLEQLTRDHPSSSFAASGLEKLAYAYWHMNDAPAAESTVRKLVAQYPATEPALRVGRDYAGKLREQSRLAEAVAILEPLARSASKSSRALVLLQLGDLFSDPRLPQVDRALAAYAEAERVSLEVLAELVEIPDPDADQLRQLRDAGALHSQARQQLAALRGQTPAP